MAWIRLFPLKHGARTQVDDADFEMLNARRWQYGPGGYAVTNFSRRGAKPRGSSTWQIAMHRLLLDVAVGVSVDHINRDKLDNRRVNLRVASMSQQMANTKLNVRNTSGFRGVTKNRKGSTWKATIGHKPAKHRKLYLGNFTTAEDAARAYNRAAKKLFGDFAQLNEVEPLF